MGQICCSTCITAYHGLDVADDISIQLKDMIFKISWGNIPYSKLLIKLNDETKKKIAVNIAKHVKEKKIAVSNFNGFVTNYISINIAGFIFHKFIWDVLYPHELEKDPGFQYPAYVPMEQEYKDIFTNKVVDKYIDNAFITQDRFVCFVEQFKKQRKLEEYNIEYQLGKEVLEKNVEKHLCTVIDELLENEDVKAFNYNKYMKIMLKKEKDYNAELEANT